MFEGLLQPMHILLILGIVLIVFGPSRLPELGKGLGESIRGFKEGLDNSHKKDDASKPAPPTAEK
ncbi:MAG TPA: twin-arginine translocase TatA/TatE family subunit [Thermoanaerobaculia bacterium]|nr:twin-arginine translocase TatA/TatE family subunit [Thermoanaerobaculia bacterium]